jgi:hypothetical protein
MKKFTLVLFTLLTLLPLGSWAESITIEGVTYDYSGTTATVTSIENTKTEAVIPAQINVGTDEPQEVNITAIEATAFSGCVNLKTLTIGENVTTIPADVFKDCSGLQTLIFKNTKLNVQSLSLNFTQSQVNPALCIIVDGVKYYHKGEWSDANHYFAVGNGSNGSGFHAATANGNQLTVLGKVCKANVTTISNNAFYSVAAGYSISLPSSITTISNASFIRNLLTAINVDDSNQTYKSIGSVLFSKDGKTLVSFPSKKGNTYSIPDGVTTIGGDAFNAHFEMTDVTIPATVTTIGQSAFHYTGEKTSLTVTFSGTSKLNTIEKSAFQQSGLSSITLPSEITTIGAQAFRNCQKLQAINLPSSLTSIGSEAFNLCKSLQNVIFDFDNPYTQLTIGGSAFYNCKLTNTIILPEGVTTIGGNAFNCSDDFKTNGSQLAVIKLPASAEFSSDIVNPFVKIYRKVNMSFSGNWSTYYSNINLALPTGWKAYTVTAVDGNTVNLTPLKYIHQQKAVVLELGDWPDGDYFEMPDNATIESDKNIVFQPELFIGTAKEITNFSSLPGDKYVLADNGDFVKSNQGTLPAFRCYIKLNSNNNTTLYVKDSNADPNTFIFFEEGTQIDTSKKNLGSVSISSGTLTVTPASGYYINKADITVKRNVSAAKGRAQIVDASLPLNHATGNDPSATQTYTFTTTEGSTYEVSVNFHKRKSLSNNNVTRTATLSATSFEYDGTEHTPGVTSFTYGGETVNSAYYDCMYVDNRNAGKGKVRITGKGEYIDTYDVEFTINKRSINHSNISISTIDSRVYSGASYEPVPTITDIPNTVNLIKPEDFTLIYQDNINAGTAKVTIKANNLNYKDQRDVTFTITPKPCSSLTITIPDQVYTGSEIKPAISIKDGDLDVPSSNYTVTYSNNTAASDGASARIVFQNNYSGERNVTFKISEAVLDRTLNVSFDTNNKYQTYFWNEDLTLPEGLKAYIVTGHTEGSPELNLTEVNFIPKNTALLLERTDNTKTTFVGSTNPTSTTLPATANTTLFKGSMEGMEISGKKFVLYKDQFVQAAEGILPANRCYLDYGTDDIGEDIKYVTIGKNYSGITILDQNGNVNSSVGTVTEETKGTLKITPSEKYFVTKDDITIIRNVNARSGRAPAVDGGKVEITEGDVAYPTVATDFKYEYNAAYQYQIIVKFRERLSFGKAEHKPTITFDSYSFTYDGTEHKPTIKSVKVGDATLTADDYDIVYSNNVNAGTARATIYGKRIYTGENGTNFKIGKRDINNLTNNTIGDVTYTGQEIRFATLGLADGNIPLDEGEDYKIEYSNNLAVNTSGNSGLNAKISIIALEKNYTGTKVINFKILPKDLSTLPVSIPDQVFTGEEIVPEFTLRDDNITLVEDRDYTIKYKDNLDAGRATATITFKGNYKGEIVSKFNIIDRGQPRTITAYFENDWATYYSAANLTLTEDLEAYVVSGLNGKNVEVQPVTFIPKNTAVLLHRLSGTNTSFEVKTCSNEELSSDITPDRSLFTGVTEDTDISSIKGTKFVLRDGKFVQTTKATLPANRCYLVMTEVPEEVTTLNIRQADDAYIYLIEGTPNNSIGKAVADKGVLTVTPNYGYYVELSNISIVRSTKSETARAPQIDEGKLELTSGDVKVNNNNTTTYKFTYPYSEGYDYQVTVNFQRSIDISKKELNTTIELEGETGLAYDGQEKKPKVTSVKYGDSQLPVETYVVTYDNNKNAGTNMAKVIVTGTGKYRESKEKTFSIAKRNLSNATIQVEDQIYTGFEIKPAPTVTDIPDPKKDKTNIINSTDYVVEYTNNVNVGTATVFVNADGNGAKLNYTGNKSLTFKIEPKDLNAEGNVPTITGVDKQVYTGDPITLQKLLIKDGVLTLEEGKDFDVEYIDNVEVGTAVATIKFKGNYKGEIQKEFEIYFVSTPKDITINFEGDNEWTTYYSSVNLGVPEGLKVYAVTGVKADKTVSLDTKEITFIPKNIGVLIQRTDKTKKEFTGMTMQSETKLEDVTPDEAHFLGTLAGIEDFTKIEGMKYVLKNDQFVQAVDGTLQANRCYILLTEKEAENVNVVDGDKDDIIVEQEGEANARAGEVLVSSVDGEGYKTIQVTPADVLYVTKNEITVLRYTGANGAFSRRVPGVNSNPVEVVPVDPTADPSKETKYKFKYDSQYKYQIIVNFQKRINLSDKANNPVVTLKAEDIKDLRYDGQEKKPAVASLTCNGVAVDPSNYTVSYENNVNSGKPRVIITGKRCLMGSTHAEFSIGKRDFSNVTIGSIADQEYTGSAIEPELDIKDMIGIVNILKSTDYSVTYSNNVAIGTATISIIPKGGNYEGAGRSITFKIVEASGIEKISVEELEDGQWFTLSGHPLVNKPTQKGVYIFRDKNRKAMKIHIK